MKVPKTGKAIVEGVAVATKHVKPKAQGQTGGIIKQELPIDASNVMVVCPVCGKATRVAYEMSGDKKIRICKKCKAPLDATKEAKAAKKTTKRKTKKAADEAAAN